MAEQEAVATKRVGNPNFSKKSEPQTGSSKYDPKRRYHFILCDIIETAKPRDRETGELVENPYPPTMLWVNEGVAIHPVTAELEQWRYLFGYGSIWVKDQQKPMPSKGQLENPKNFIEFKSGSLFVMGTNTALLDALMIQDHREGIENPVNIVPPVYRLIEPEKDRQVASKKAKDAFLAEQTAWEANLEEMLPVAMHFGIDIDNPEADEERIRHEFVMRAKQSPDAFMHQFGNPKAKYKYIATMALRANLISGDVIPGKMVLVETGKPYFDLRSGDYAEQFATQVLTNQHEPVKLYEQLKTLLAN